MKLEVCHIVYQSKFKNKKLVSIESLLRVEGYDDVESYIKNHSNPVSLDFKVISLVYEDMKTEGFIYPLSINASYHSLIDDNFIAEVVRLFKNSNVTLELTEFFEVSDFYLLKKNIEKLKKNRISVSLDDFGKDFSRAYLLTCIDFDEVKIDKTLIDSIDSSYACFKHLLFITDKIKQFGIDKIVFEGVERDSQLKLIDLICEDAIIQGYYYSKPLNIIDLIASNYECDFSIESLNKKPIEDNLSELVYELVLSENKSLINDKILSADFSGTVGNLNYEKTISNFKEFNCRKDTYFLNAMLKVIESSEKFIVIRNNEGVVVYENVRHREFFGMALTGEDPLNIIDIYPDYANCLQDDNDLIHSNRFFSITNERFNNDKVIRQKSYHNENFFIVTTIYKEEDGSHYNYDDLTGCFLRDYLNRVDVKNKFNNKVVAFLDLNGFKKINDSMGHFFGDECLVEFVDFLKLNLRSQHEEDIVVRYGGDEFVILFESNDIESIKCKLLRINIKVKKMFISKGLSISFSFGVVLNENNDLINTIECADKNMYEMKNSFHNRVH